MSDVQQALRYFQILDYASGILIAGVMYDYFLTFPREVEYIWLKPWTWVSTLFVIVRYLGILQALGQFKLSFYSDGTVFFLVNQWSLLLFVAAGDFTVVMILRIYAMWGRSKIILGLCLFIYVSHLVISFVFAAIFDNPNTHMSATTLRFLDMSTCYITMTFPSSVWLYLAPSYPVTITLFILPLIQTCKEAFNMYKATKKWQPNRYMSLLIRDGIIYFVVRSFYDIQWPVSFEENVTYNLVEPIMGYLSLMLLFSMLPRFIIGIRDLYDHDSHRQGIDTGFGILSRFATANVVLSGIGFAEDGANGEIKVTDMTPLPVVTSRV